MNKYLTDVRLMRINFTIVIYFISIYLYYLFKIDFTLIGILREILTIPFFIAQIVFLILGVEFLMKEESKNSLTIISIIVLALCSIITVGSFFY